MCTVLLLNTYEVSRPQISLNLMKTTVLNSFLKFCVMGSPKIDLLDIVHLKVGFFVVLKMCIRGPLGKFV